MADDRHEPSSKPAGKNQPSPAPVPDRLKAQTAAAVHGSKGLVGELQDATHDNKAPSHTPTVPEESDNTASPARGRNPDDPPTSLRDRLEEWRRMLPALGLGDRCHDNLDR